ncbi:MAG: peptide-methionine (S)-S-oxide reductase MsrA [Chthonomonadales bacterium]
MSSENRHTETAAPLREEAVLAGGCFWCTEAAFKQLKGVELVQPGYTGGTTPNPTYQQVCTGQTGHAEAVRIVFDPNVIRYRDLLHVFFTIHDPTTINRQGADIGSQYRSAIFYRTPQQRAEAQEVIHEIEEAKWWPAPVVTEVAPFTHFYPAEEYHVDYYQRNPNSAYCRVVISPKIAKLRQKFTQLLAR